MKLFCNLLLLALTLFSMSAHANDEDSLNFQRIDPQLINYHLQENKDDSWIKTHTSQPDKFFSLSSKKTNSFRDEVEMAWSFSNLFSINVNLFEDGNYKNYFNLPSQSSPTRSLNKSASRSLQPTLDTNTRLKGYKIGLSSDFGIGNQFKLGINLDYGKLNGADLIGFNTNNVNMSSFALGIKNKKFGASLITDSVIENNNFLSNQARMGFEIDWHFSENTTFSFGSKQQIKNTDDSSQTTNFDNLSGNVQYIKFQYNL